MSVGQTKAHAKALRRGREQQCGQLRPCSVRLESNMPGKAEAGEGSGALILKGL